MLWADEIASRVDGPQIVNDSKTPSGRVHVGALRGVIIHDAVYRALRDRGLPARYMFGVDDYDPLDELPVGQADFYRPYLGVPLCNVPAPRGSDAPDMAVHYIREFFDVFHALGVGSEFYYMRNVYRSGQFNEAIDAILRKADIVREIYREVSGSNRPDTWYPFHVICEHCGRIGTTEVVDYDGQEVTYVCRPDLVKWATGCGHRGKVSPFDGHGKLPWKLEWTAKWHTFGVTIEGAGKDHSSRGGSRDVAEACLRRIFGEEPPLNIPYEFFLVGGSKMSSSRGVGVSAREMADVLPPEQMRFLILRTPPNRAVNFSPTMDSIVKLFNDYDRLWERVREGTATEEERRAIELSQVTDAGAHGPLFVPSYQLVLTFVQMPHLSLEDEFARRKGRALNERERHILRQREDAARYWLEHFAGPDDRISLQESLPARAWELSEAQRGFLHRLADRLEDTPWEEAALQSAIFLVARLTPIEQPTAFAAIYRVFLDHTSGPRAGDLLAALERDFVLGRLRDLPYSRPAFWRETAMAPDEVEHWLAANAAHVREARVSRDYDAAASVGELELAMTLDDGKAYGRRVVFEGDLETFTADADAFLRRLEKAMGDSGWHGRLA